ncbi:MAG: chemotaxis response regulator protein-glutamate methylesterase [Alphaproteobacteria bacterium]|nr:chemotaxis response regulator protein-glutamate methylesterase [Alphaproteobacteria bacterium]
MVVDDSAVIRGLIRRWLEEDPEIQVIAAVGNGVQALQQVARTPPEVMVLDIEMPEMDGMTALPQLVRAVPDVRVIMASTLTARNAQISMEALAKGAADYIPKPSSQKDLHGSDFFRNELREKVKAHGAQKRRRAGQPQPSPVARPSASAPGAAAPAASPAARYMPGQVVLRPRPPVMPKPDVLAIGSSTGGPQALFAVFEVLKNQVKVPILITQHMPGTFTAILAEHIAKASGAPCAEGKDGEVVEGGKIYVAPGDWHMVVAVEGGKKVIRLNQDPPENFCRPAVDPMFRSICAAYGPKVLSVVLTGMGQDGLLGGKKIIEAGGTMLAQDEASSVVWGMPGAVATAGICSAVLPIKDMGGAVLKGLQGILP